MKKAFIVFEGLDGSGKTTIVKMLCDKLNEKGIKALSFKEPGDDNSIGRAFREMSKRSSELPPLTSAHLLAAERFWRSQQISRWLEEGYTVIADRFYLSGMVYCGAEGLSFEKFAAIHHGIIKPDFYIYLDISFSLMLKRKGAAKDRWEEKGILQKAASLYPRACEYIRKTEAADICTIVASQPIAGVIQEAFNCISKRVQFDISWNRM